MRTAIIFFDSTGAIYSVANVIADGPLPDAQVAAQWNDPNIASAVACWGTSDDQMKSYASKPGV